MKPPVLCSPDAFSALLQRPLLLVDNAAAGILCISNVRDLQQAPQDNKFERSPETAVRQASLVQPGNGGYEIVYQAKVLQVALSVFNLTAGEKTHEHDDLRSHL